MPEIKVDTYLRHNTDQTLTSAERNEHEWQAIHVKKIIKGEGLADRARFDWRLKSGFRTRIDRSNSHVCETDICSRYAERIVATFGALTIVPVPNGAATIGGNGSFRTLDLARRIAGASAGQIAAFDALRWAEPMGKAHLGERRRNVDDHQAKLRVKEGCGDRVVIFDDVVTTGSQLCAAKQMLERAGKQVVGLYAILDVLDEGIRGSAPGWATVTRNPQDIGDLFDSYGFSPVA